MNNKLPVVFYIPNIVGYVRFVLILMALYFMVEKPLFTFFLCVSSVSMDALDGFLARRLNQSSKLGTILDYALDRATVAAFFFGLGTIYPKYLVVFVICMALDIVSHFFHLKSVEIQGKPNHKHIGANEPLLIRIYYLNKFNLTTICIMHDLFLGSLFLHHSTPNLIVKSLILISCPGFLLKTAIHATKIIRSSQILIANEESTKTQYET
jgi:CDP-diacylglycerol--inositol 3-phosphatidyltransferase